MSDLRNRAHLALVAAAGGAAAFFLLLRWQKHSSDSKRACTLAECFESHRKEVAVAVELALQCGAAMRACDGKRSATVWKDDHGIDPVTQTDQDNETLVTKGLAAAFPGHVIIGEEAAAAAENIPPLGRDASTWIVDPIGSAHSLVLVLMASRSSLFVLVVSCLFALRRDSELHARCSFIGCQHRIL
jgi:hypothetical protein